MSVNEGASNAPDDRYVTFREHADLKDRVTRLDASLSHLPAQVQALATRQSDGNATLHEIKTKLERGPASDPGLSQLALALHSWADAQRATPAPQSFPFSVPTIVTVAGALMILGALMGQIVGVGNMLGVTH